MAAEEDIASGAETDPTTYDLHAETDVVAEPNFTTLQASGELLSVTAGVEEQGVTPIAQQDIYEPAAPVAVEGAVQSVTLAEAETTPEPVEFEEEFQPQIHAYGDGEFHEEEMDEEDEYEDEALAGNADDEEDEYEEETLEDTADLGGVLHEMHLDREVPSEDFDEEDASGVVDGDEVAEIIRMGESEAGHEARHPRSLARFERRVDPLFTAPSANGY